MLELFLNMFTTEDKVQAMLGSPIIRLIFLSIIVGFLLTVLVHFLLYFRMKALNNYVKSTKRLDVDPFRQMLDQYESSQSNHVPLETFIQEQFSKWTFLQIPILNLMKMIRATISIFILLGVLGTFIGLTISLAAIETGGEALLDHIVLVLSGIDVAFYTSILGMSASLIVTLLTRVFNTEYVLTDLMLGVESALAVKGRQGVGRLIEETSGIKQAIHHLQETNEAALQELVSSFTGFKDYTAGLERAAKDLKAFNEGLSHNLGDFQTLFQQMEKNTSHFQEGTDQLNQNFKALINYFKGTDERNDYIASRLEQTFVNVEKTLVSQELIAEKVEASAGHLESFTSGFLEQYGKMRQEMTSINHSLAGVGELLGQHHGDFKRLFGENMTAALEEVAHFMKDLTEEFRRFDESLYHFPQALEEVSKAYQRHEDLINDRYREVKHFNESFHEHLREHKMESTAFEQQMRQARSSFEEMGRENHELLQAMSRTIGQFQDRSLGREQTLEEGMRRLEQSLQQFLDHLEYGLGQELQYLQGEMQQSTARLVQAIQADFNQLRGLQENLLQEQVRSFQQLLQGQEDAHQATIARLIDHSGRNSSPVRAGNRSAGQARLIDPVNHHEP